VVRLRQKLDSSSKIYIPKILREAGFDKEIEIAPNTRALVAFPSGTPLEEVVASIEIIRQDLEQSIQLAARSKQSSRRRSAE
jgi:hypothetical protein